MIFPLLSVRNNIRINFDIKEDFTNIVLVFDYERHDINFPEEKILEMQRCFADAADMGRLYINYPPENRYKEYFE